MSEEAIAYARRVALELGARITSGEKLVLRAVAWFTHPDSLHAWPSHPQLGAESWMSERQAQRLLDKLVERGLVRRYTVLRERDGSQSTNDYELVGFREFRQGAAGGLQGSVQAFGAEQDGVSMAARQEPQQVARKGRGAGRTRVQSQPTQRELQMRTNASATGAVEFAPDVTPPGDTRCQGKGDSRCHPVKVVEQKQEQNPYPTLCPVAEGEEKLPVNAKASANATANATATPKTWAVRTAEAKRAVAVQPSLSPAARRTSSDSAEAMLEGECRRVLVACGIDPETSTRRMRETVTGALRMRCETARCAVGEAGDLAARRWREYRETAGRGLLRWVCGPRKFFSGGVWLTPELWPVDQDRARRGGL